jgi:D-alanyl-D-alanine carboxypeptidase/D-alanyl-D-alanine-endopeptidase (penicillin-binding protein 4)
VTVRRVLSLAFGAGRALSTSLFVVAGVCAGLLAWPVGPFDAPGATHARASVGARAAPAITPVLSLRRLPVFLGALAAGRHLQDDIQRAFADARIDPPGGQACLVVHGAGGQTVYARRPDLPLAPASTIKLLTAATVLERIGPDARLATAVRAGQRPVNGVIDGDLWVVGGGDPLLATADFAARAGISGRPRPASRLEDLADKLIAAGVRQVRGRLLGDEHRYDTLRYVPTWKPDYIEQGQSGPLSALMVNGGFATALPAPVPASAPAADTAGQLATLLSQRGVHVDGVGGGVAPAGSVVVTSLESLPMRQIVTEMLNESDNTTAELLTKELGYRFGGVGSTAAGVGVTRATARVLTPGLADDFVVRDGSGLDASNRTTCRALTALLDTPRARELGASLPVAARSGTLAGRFVGTPAAGRLAAKTGSLAGVVALSGFATDARDELLAFTILVNDPRDAVARLLVDRVAVVLVGDPQSPPPAELGPRRP